MDGLNIHEKKTTGLGQENIRETETATMATAGVGSMFDTETTGTVNRVIETVEKIAKDKGSSTLTAKAVSIAANSQFEAVVISVVHHGTKFAQCLLIDEREVLDVKELVEDSIQNKKPIIMSTTVLDKKYRRLLSNVDDATSDAIELERLVLLKDQVKTDTELYKYLIRVLVRIETMKVATLEKDIKEDKDANLSANVRIVDKEVNLHLGNNSTDETIESVIIGSGNNSLTLTGRYDATLCLKEVVENGASMTRHAMRPVFYLKSFNRPRSIVASSLEYGLFSIVASTVMAAKDKVFTAYMPNANTKSNLGQLNPILNTLPNAKGEYKAADLNSPKVDLGMKCKYIEDTLVSGTVGIFVEYRTEPTALSAFVTAHDPHALTEESTKAKENLKNAIKSITGKEYKGSYIASAKKVPAGTITMSNGDTESLEIIDAVWLANLNSPRAHELAERWLTSDTQADGYLAKIEILADLMSETQARIVADRIAYKLILSDAFVNFLVENSDFTVESRSILDIPSTDNRTLSGIGNLSVIKDGVSSVGIDNTNFGGNSLKVFY